jgi:hypothetical protein
MMMPTDNIDRQDKPSTSLSRIDFSTGCMFPQNIC